MLLRPNLFEKRLHSRALARDRLQSVELPVPNVLIGADNVENGKPDPEGFLAAARRLGADNTRCLVFEDTPPGLKAATAAGMRGIAISTTYSHQQLGSGPCIKDFVGAEIERLPDHLLRVHLSCY